MSAGDSLLVALERNDHGPELVGAGALRSAAKGSHENAGGHDALEAVIPDALNDVEQPVAVLELRRFFDEETSLQTMKRHDAPPTLLTAERVDCALNAPLIQKYFLFNSRNDTGHPFACVTGTAAPIEPSRPLSVAIE